MLLCVQSHRPLMLTPATEVATPSKWTDPHHCFSSMSLHCIHSIPPLQDTKKDLLSIGQTFHYLDISGWYWGAVSASKAQAVLQDAQEGTFLVRDSSHPLYMLTLSVKTQLGPTNVRIEYCHGQFRLDSNSLAKPRLLTFPNVPSLVQHYVKSSQDVEDAPPPPQQIPKENALLLKLVRPLHRQKTCPSLQHLTRLAINRLTGCPAQLPLPRPLLLYLQDYPFQL